VDGVKKARITPAAWGRIKLFAMDVDGILTDGSVQISSDGTETKRFSIIDGMGLMLVRTAGVDLAWISGRKSACTGVRAAELKIAHVIEGRHDKLAVLAELARECGIAIGDCAYMGDDFIDAPAIEAAGIGISVPNGLPEAIAAADYVTRKKGGRGAVREVCDHILRARTAGNPKALARTLT
jgi:3-deoxy-D-manno-octulosonate 8-phosphate phosphatase (KDO 8-P phosphatase)